METRSDQQHVGVFGGSFDPVHNGHLAVAEAVVEQHRLDRLIFVPAYLQPHKTAPPMASGRQRLAMLELALAGRDAFSVSDCELQREGKSFTVDTISHFRRQLGPAAKLFFILGSDSVGDLPKWKDLPRLAATCQLVVAARPGAPLDGLDALAAHLPGEQVEAIQRAAVRTTASPASSTEIRRRLAAGQPIARLVPPAVALYVARNKLYI